MSIDKKTEYVSSGVFMKDSTKFFKEDFLKQMDEKSKVSTNFKPLIQNLPDDGRQLNHALFYEYIL